MTPEPDQASWPIMAAILIALLGLVLLAVTVRTPRPEGCQQMLDPRASGDRVCIEMAP